MEVKINREIRNYTEAMFFGLSLRQFIFSACACVSVAVLSVACSTAAEAFASFCVARPIYTASKSGSLYGLPEKGCASALFVCSAAASFVPGKKLPDRPKIIIETVSTQEKTFFIWFTLFKNKAFAYAYTDLLYKKTAKNAMKKTFIYINFHVFLVLF